MTRSPWRADVHCPEVFPEVDDDGFSASASASLTAFRTVTSVAAHANGETSMAVVRT